MREDPAEIIKCDICKCNISSKDVSDEKNIEPRFFVKIEQQSRREGYMSLSEMTGRDKDFDLCVKCFRKHFSWAKL